MNQVVQLASGPGGKRSAPGPEARGGTVTLPERLTGEPTDAFFVDWLTLHQSHEIELPTIDAGHVMGIDEDGELVWKTARTHRLQGSWESSVGIRCDGHTVWFEGNVSRFNRSNNLFGFGLAECMRRVNALLQQLGLPPFTFGRRYLRPLKTREFGALTNSGLVQECWTGCRVSRIDLTANYATGSKANARAYMEWLATQQHSARVKVGTHPDGETVDWGRGSKRVYAKCYDKGSELRRRGAPADLVEFCDAEGVVRFEVTAKSTQLADMGCQFLGSLDMEQLDFLFRERKAVMARAEHTHDDFQHLPNHFRRTVRDYLAGDDVRAAMSLATFKRHRKALLAYGIDLAVRRNVIDFKPRVRVIELRPLAVPSWYQFDERKAA